MLLEGSGFCMFRVRGIQDLESRIDNLGSVVEVEGRIVEGLGALWGFSVL